MTEKDCFPPGGIGHETLVATTSLTQKSPLQSEDEIAVDLDKTQGLKLLQKTIEDR